MHRTSLLAICFVLAGCASVPDESSSAVPPITPINDTRLEVKADLIFLPSLSGYCFPAGIYLPVAEDGKGVFYQSPRGIKGIGLGNPYYPVGGIYRFKRSDGTHGLRNWQGSPKVGFLSSELFDMIGADFTKNVVFHQKTAEPGATDNPDDAQRI